jgi:hypothetical protein
MRRGILSFLPAVLLVLYVAIGMFLVSVIVHGGGGAIGRNVGRFWDSLGTFARIVLGVALVAPPVVFLQVKADQGAAQNARRLSRRVDCPACHTRTLSWESEYWTTTDTAAGDGIILHCTQCGGDFHFTNQGKFVSKP